MANPTVVEILRQVSALLHDTDPQFARWSERDCVSYLNDGQRAIAKFLPASSTRVDSIKLLPTSRQSIAAAADAEAINLFDDTVTSVDGMMLTDVIRLMGNDGRTPGRALRVAERDAIDAAKPDWHTKEGAPVNWFFNPATPQEFYIYPHPAPAATLWAEISFVANPQDVPNNGTPQRPSYGQDSREETAISIGATWTDDLVSYIVARCYMRDSEDAANAQLASVFAQQFIASINAQVTIATGKNPNLKMLPFAPAIPAAAQ